MSDTYYQGPFPSHSNKTYYFKRPCPVPLENRLCIPEKNSFNFYVITKYICALLNSRGGTLLIGAESDFTVRGRKLNREEIDKFQRHVDEALKQFNPSVKGHEYSINFHPVNFDEGKKIIVKDLYVIEISIMNPDDDDLYFTHYDECWVMRPDSQIDQVPVTELRDFMEKSLDMGTEARKNELQHQIDLYEGKNLDTLSQEELIKLRENIQTTLSMIQQQKTSQASVQE